MPAIGEIGIREFLFGTTWASTAKNPEYGILPFILSSVYGTFGAILIGVPFMDEPTSALDPISTSRIEDLAVELRKKYTIIMVTHNMQQAARISDKTAFFLMGEIVEFNETDRVFSSPDDKRTEDYISGRFG